MEDRVSTPRWGIAFRLPNPFRINLSRADFLAGKPSWRFPVSLWID